MRILMIGAPGAGKGTQAARVAEHFSFPHISSGDLLRAEVRAGTRIGEAVKVHLDDGSLVPDEILLDILRSRVSDPSLRNGYVLDGFPRTVEQAEAAHEIAAPFGAHVQAAVHLDVPRQALVDRMLARALEEGRTDDRPDVIERRLDVFDEHTRPLIDYYRERETVVTIDGDREVDEVARSLIGELEDLRPALRDPRPS